MYNAVMHKFMQDRTLKSLLLSTAHGGERRMIIEHTTNDSYWGDGGVPHWKPGDSGNELGQLLVRIRGESLPLPLPLPLPLTACAGSVCPDEIHYNSLQNGGQGYVLPAAHAAALPPPPTAAAAAAAAAAASAAAGGRMCGWCRAKPAHAGHDYCGRKCGSAASQAGHNPHSHGNPVNPAPAAGYGHAVQHRVTCPAGVGPGQEIEIRLGTGELRKLRVPAGVYPGMEIVFQ